MKTFIFIASMVFLNFSASAAPHPATATSALIVPEVGLFKSPLGFTISAVDTDWELTPGNADNLFTVARYQPSQNPEASLSVRVDKVSEKLSLENYARKWLKDYPHYGFEVLGSKLVKIGGSPAFLIDLVHNKKQRQLRQVVFYKDVRAIVLTCSDDKGTFSESLIGCNKIIRSFQWTR